MCSRDLLYFAFFFHSEGIMENRFLLTDIVYACYNQFSNINRKLVGNKLGAVSIRKTVLPGVAIPMLKIRRPNGRLIFNIGIAIPR